MEINKIIHDRRIELGLTLKDVANALHIAESTVSRYESSDIQNMGIDKIEALAKVLRCSPAFLMGWETPEDRTDAFSRRIMTYYNKLNPLGMEEAAKRIEELTCIDKYTENTNNVVQMPNTDQQLNAAHSIPGASMEDIQHDEDIMDDEDF